MRFEIFKTGSKGIFLFDIFYSLNIVYVIMSTAFLILILRNVLITDNRITTPLTDSFYISDIKLMSFCPDGVESETA